jgi:two-component system response regulator YesN
MLKVLVVEDEDIPRKGLVHMVDWAKLDCCVAGEAKDGREGLALIAKLRPDLVITDVRMPFMDGIEMLRQSISEFSYEALIVSGFDEFGYAQQAISLGVSDYLLKPIDMKALSATVKKIGAKIKEKRELLWYYPKKDDKFDREILNAEPMRTKNRNVAAILDYVERHYADKVCIEDICREIGVSSTYLGTQFKRETNCTFNSYLNRYRILRSLELLKSGDLRVYEIADSVGFRDYKYFAQVFKKLMGCSPLEFYNSHNFE